MAKSGQVPSQASAHAAASALTSALGEANLQKEALGFGQPADGGAMGRFAAVWAKGALTGATSQILDLPHSLGRVPVSVVLDHVDCPPGTEPMHVSAQPYDKDKWTATLCRMHIYLVGPTRSNNVGVFQVRGE